MPTLDLDNFNIICALGGGFVGLFCLISYLAKERFYLSEARESLSFSQDLMLIINSHSIRCWYSLWTWRRMDSARGIRRRQ